MIKNVEQYAAEQSERNIYFAIDLCGAFIWRMTHDLGHGRFPPDACAGVQADVEVARQDQLILITLGLPRFGVEGPLDDKGLPTTNYWKWYRWWDQWKKGLSDEEWDACNLAMDREGKGIPLTPEEDQKYRPTGSWQDHDGVYR